MDDVKEDVFRKFSLKKREVLDELEHVNNDDIDRKIYLRKKYESLNLFEELFSIAYSKSTNKKDEVYNKFIQITKDFVDSCKVHQFIKMSSWAIHLEIYDNVDEFIRQLI